ncbi:hypothetical protein Kisp01_34630 [Kineosporia sp. NBRC 101677]|nr:hypothetical protein Kisp01_34630 [Kineosporia sp. NBRC 101677]
MQTMDREAERPTHLLGVLAVAAVPVAAVPAPGTLTSAVLYLASVSLSLLFISRLVGQVPAHRRRGWRLVQLSLGVSLLGEVLFKTWQHHDHTVYPTPGDPFYLLSYLPLAAGLLELNRRRGGHFRLGDRLDVLIVTASAACLALVFLVLPVMRDDHLGLAGQAVSSAYPLMDVLMVFAAVRMLIDGGRRTPTLWLLVTGLSCLLAGDVAQQLAGADTDSVLFPRWVNSLWLMSYLGLALAIAPAARPGYLPPQPSPGQSPMTVTRLACMTLAAALPPTLLIAEAGRAEVGEQVLLSIGTVVLVALLMLRFWDLHRQLEQHRRAMGELAATDGLTGRAGPAGLGPAGTGRPRARPPDRHDRAAGGAGCGPLQAVQRRPRARGR